MCAQCARGFYQIRLGQRHLVLDAHRGLRRQLAGHAAVDHHHVEALDRLLQEMPHGLALAAVDPAAHDRRGADREDLDLLAALERGRDMRQRRLLDDRGAADLAIARVRRGRRLRGGRRRRGLRRSAAPAAATALTVSKLRTGARSVRSTGL